MCPFIELSGKQFQTFNVHQLLHLAEVVRDLGPLWSNSCFPFEDYNGDLRDLFHGTKNVNGQVCFLKALIHVLIHVHVTLSCLQILVIEVMLNIIIILV